MAVFTLDVIDLPEPMVLSASTLPDLDLWSHPRTHGPEMGACVGD